MKQWTANQQNISDAGIWEDKLDPSTEYQKNIYFLFRKIPGYFQVIQSPYNPADASY